MCYSVFVVQNLKEIESMFGAVPYKGIFDIYEKKSAEDPKKYKALATNPRIYPGYYAPIVTNDEKNNLCIIPMRYRMRPHWAENELPAKYNLFNARVDSLRARKSWSSVLMKHHGVLVFKAFFEWVEDKETKKKVVVSFHKENHEAMFAPVLFDIYGGGDEALRSFAILTTEPTSEILQEGHDRCPVLLDKNEAISWVNTEALNLEKTLEKFKHPPQVSFEFKIYNLP